jgi:hypothetical protein
MTAGSDDGVRTVDDAPTVIFLHIGKTAGSTLRQVLRRQFRASETMVVRSPVRDPKRLRREETLAYFAGLPETERRRPRLILGHTIFGLHEYVPRPSTYITLMRDPVSLVLSQYYYVRRTPGHWLYETAQRMTLDEYVRSGVSLETDNSQTRAISGDTTTEFGHCSRAMLDVARRNIEEHFSVIGLVERFDASLVMLGRHFGWSKLAYVRVNVAPQDQRREVSTDTREAIERQNAIDLELYGQVQQAFDRRVDADPAFERDLRRLQRQKAFYTPWGRLTRTWPRRVMNTIGVRRHPPPEIV